MINEFEEPERWKDEDGIEYRRESVKVTGVAVQEDLSPKHNVCEDHGAMGCEVCGKVSNHYYIHARCHPSSPLHVGYDIEHGVLVIECAECGQLVVPVGVAEDHPLRVKR